MDFCRSELPFLIFLTCWSCVTCNEILSLLRSDNGDVCITNSSSSFYYTLTDGSISEETKLIPTPTYFCEFEEDDGCTNHFTTNSIWKRVNSLDYENIPIFDTRWEDLPVRTLQDNQLLLELKQKENFNISLSVRATDVEFFFCDREVITTAFCYGFSIHENSRNCIFDKPRSVGVATTEKDINYKSCEKRRYTDKDEPLIEMKKWRHFTLESKSDTIYLKKIQNGKTTVILQHKNESNNIHLKYMFGASRSIAYCKLHTYGYLRTTRASNTLILSENRPGKIQKNYNNSACFFVFLTTCDSCVTDVVAYHRGRNRMQNIFATETLPPSYGHWTRYKILFHDTASYGDNYFNIAFRTKPSTMNSNNFWSIDSFRYCSVEEYRASVKPAAQIKSCELLDPSTSLTWQQPTDIESSNCKSNDLLGGLCLSCTEMTHNNIVKTCQRLRFCEIVDGVEKCFCQTGFTGHECQKDCPDGTFGKGCRQKCGHCSSNGTCNKVNGSCECDAAFKGATCHSPIRESIMKEPPTVISSSPNSCKIQFDNKKYYGEKPLYYLRQYKRETSNVSSNNWTGNKSEVAGIVANNTIEIEHLQMSTKYLIRILVSKNYEEIQLFENYSIPITICNTTCYEWEEGDLNIIEKNGTVFFRIENYQNKCNASLYSWKIKTSDDIEILNGSGQIPMNLTGLLGGTKFRIYFIGPNNKNISKIFETLERASEPPVDLSSYFLENNTFGAYWKNPNKTNGVLKHFEVNLTIRHNVISICQAGKHIQFSETIPPSEDVQVEVAAINSMRGEPAIIKDSSYPSCPNLLNPQILAENSTDTKISITINTTIEKHENMMRNHFYLYILVSKLGDSSEEENLKTLKKVVGLKKLVGEVIDKENKLRIAAEFYLNDIKSGLLEYSIGKDVNQTSKLVDGLSILDKPLVPDKYYNITILLVSGYKGKFNFKSYNTGSIKTKPYKTNYNALFLLLLLIPLLAGFIILRKRICNAVAELSIRKIMCFERISTTRLMPKEYTPEIEGPELNSKIEITALTNLQNTDEEILSKPVKIANLEEYVKQAIETGELTRQHDLFPPTYTQPCIYGSLPANKSKNRYNNLFPYDHSRVKLEKLPGDDYSDYINANFIHGYKVPNAFIATQGPKQSTLEDFWRMIWEQNVKHIIMLANVYESGKKKVEQYWPNVNEELKIGNLFIKFISVEIFSDFEFKTFDVRRGHEIRKLEHFHFISWPDHGVPLYPQSVVPFLRKMLKIRISSSHPVVIHCSAGVGRTGTILLSDICLRMAAKEGAVDLLYHLQIIRQQRARMVDNVEQYKLAHLVILETLMSLHTSIPCNQVEQAIEKLLITQGYKTQMDYLIQTQWKDDAMKSVTEADENFVVYPEKNRFDEFIPDNKCRILLTRYPEHDLSSSYINAIKVDGFRNPDRYIVTQNPMPNTLSEFWRLVVEQKTRVIISLNKLNLKDESCCQFFPTAEIPEIRPVDYMSITLRKTHKMKDYDIHYVQIRLKNEEKRMLDVAVVSFKLWKPGEELPSNHENFLSFWEEADTISRKSERVLLTCYDGRTASGIYVALSFVIEKIKLEQECDVCLAVRTIRHNRKQFVSSEVQFLFLYEVAVRYIRGFQSYANFQDQ